MLNGGFTFVEALIALAISGVLGVILVSIVVQSNGLFLTQTSKTSQGVNINDVNGKIVDAIRQSAYVATGYPVASPLYSSTSTTLVLAIPSIDINGDVIQSTYDYVVITQDATKENILKKYLFPDQLSSRNNENTVLSTQLSMVKFNYLDSNLATVAPTQAAMINYIINLSSSIGAKPTVSSSSGQVNLRNN